MAEEVLVQTTDFVNRAEHPSGDARAHEHAQRFRPETLLLHVGPPLAPRLDLVALGHVVAEADQRGTVKTRVGLVVDAPRTVRVRGDLDLGEVFGYVGRNDARVERDAAGDVGNRDRGGGDAGLVVGLRGSG